MSKKRKKRTKRTTTAAATAITKKVRIKIKIVRRSVIKSRLRTIATLNTSFIILALVAV
jgi:hypothetical protein